MASYMGATGSIGSPTSGKIPGYRTSQLQQFTPDQMNLFKSLFGQVAPGSFLSRLSGGDEGAFNQLQSPALKQFSELLGGIGSRFSGMGGSGGQGQGSFGARRSSGFQNATTQAASDFAEKLQSQRLALQMQALEELMGMSSQLLQQRPYEQYLMPKKKSFLENILGGSGGLLSGLGKVGSFFI